MSYVAEIWLYHALTPTSFFRYSDTSDSGPWTDFQLSAPMTIRDALAALATEISTDLGIDLQITFNAATNRVMFATDWTVWIEFTDTLANLLGFSTTVVEVNDGGGSDETPVGITACDGISIPPPWEIESSELREYRGGRAVGYHRQRVRMLRAQVALDIERLVALEGGTLLHSGKQRFSGPNADPFGVADLDGYHDAWPLKTRSLTAVEGEDGLAVMTLDATLEDPT